uniref:Uncharacterized protein n=1 Tax=Pseudo-nitzschia australis TaxID=44445 RepID=A0A7S4AWQ9_9STRA|mmetsp:Transcript_9676/g.20955  ORF Transcript_9676/g.20955 Transcript_9676/m.20955 type:complete len:198 (-) Transcript_9676:22-615(-)
MKQIKSTAKTTITRIAKVPQTIGHSILSVPDTLLNKHRQGETHNEERDEVTDESKNLHGKLCSDIIDDQIARSTVTESLDECMREITDHLNLFLFEKSNTSSERYQYEEWILALHPENVHYIGSGRSLIDHRFYMKDSHHRQLWNDFMIKMECTESVVPEESREINNRNRSLVNILMEQPEELCCAMSDSCCFSPQP